jgi:hypothetical protein
MAKRVKKIEEFEVFASDQPHIKNVYVSKKINENKTMVMLFQYSKSSMMITHNKKMNIPVKAKKINFVERIKADELLGFDRDTSDFLLSSFTFIWENITEAYKPIKQEELKQEKPKQE